MSDPLLGKLVGDLTSMLKSAFFRGYKKGLIDGMERFSWMKDGTTYVGTCGTTLKQAIIDLEKDEMLIRHQSNENYEENTK